MTEFALVLAIFALGALLAWEKYENRKERSKLINAIMSRNAEQFRDIEFVDKVRLETKPPVIDPMVSTADMTEEEFDKHIEEQLKNAN